MTYHEARLDELDKQEWRDIVRHAKPDISDDEFNAMWKQFIEEKKKRSLQ